MGTDHTGDVRGFHHLSRAWYASACKRGGVEDEVTFGFYCPDGGTSGEMTMTFEYLGGAADALFESVERRMAYAV